MSEFVFESAEEALKWAVEVLRRRRLPRAAGFWQEIEAEADEVERVWQGSKNVSLPTDADDRMQLALRVMECAAEVAGQDALRGKVLQLWAWGDWVDEGRLAVALAMQEKCRREGVRVRMAYRYSYAQLGVLLDCDKKVAWRRVQEGLGLLKEVLEGRGLLQGIEVPLEERVNFKKSVYLYEFKN